MHRLQHWHDPPVRHWGAVQSADPADPGGVVVVREGEGQEVEKGWSSFGVELVPQLKELKHEASGQDSDEDDDEGRRRKRMRRRSFSESLTWRAVTPVPLDWP